MRNSILGLMFGLAMALVLAAGCESRVSKEDLGQVVFEMPAVPAGTSRWCFPSWTQANPRKPRPEKARSELTAEEAQRVAEESSCGVFLCVPLCPSAVRTYFEIASYAEGWFPTVRQPIRNRSQCG